jgi:VanZ family protein
MTDPAGPLSACPSWLRWLIWGVYNVAWATALLTPQPVELADQILPTHTQFTAAKSLHIAAYAVLTILTSWLCVRRGWRWALLAFVSLHAMGTEFFQQFVPRRHGTLEDVGIDHIGILIGVLLSWRAWWRP